MKKVLQRLGLTFLRAKFNLVGIRSKRKAAEQAFAFFCTPPQRHKIPLTPFFKKAEQLHHTIENIDLTGWRFNKGTARKAMVIHGFMSSATNFEHIIRRLTELDYEVLAFDAPAHGRSGGKQLTALLYGKVIRAFTNLYGPFDAFLAHSLGGLALTLALEQMPHTPQTKVVLLAPATETTTAIRQYFDLIPIRKSIREEFEQVIIRINNHPGNWYSVSRAIRSVQASVLWIHDEKDNMTPYADAERVKNDKLPHIEFFTTQGLGHRRIYRDAEVMKKISAFLS